MKVIRDSSFFYMLGLAYKAGNVFLGEENTKKAVLKDKCGLIVVDESASGNTMGRITHMGNSRNIPVLTTRVDMLGRSVGRLGIVALAVCNGHFSDQLITISNKLSE